jgi:Crinkler effector protein N-terminal domain
MTSVNRCQQRVRLNRHNLSAVGLDLSIDACVLVFQTHSPLLVRLHNTMLRLFCYVRGDLYNRVFEVKIGKEESVAAHKENIKEKANIS